MLNCQEATQLMSQSQDRALTFSESLALKLHLLMCSGCTRFGKQMHALRHMARTYAVRPDEAHSAENPTHPDDQKP